MESHKEKSKELIRKNLIIISNLEIIYGNNIDFEELKLDKNFKKAIECAKIPVEEIINEFQYNSKQDIKNGYWQEVKNELNNM